ncbi:hypothetical protein FIM1_3937 [Kluyveromyces marxianus]|uniref:Uncharacterized protein n=1 Tax=Kluyveromyces marxianus TaxID=4911 RepID=A0ABX6F017_KLUMA|nr:hypothetical protein FIM1_3937 [Kluyveromyces marxianus]
MLLRAANVCEFCVTDLKQNFKNPKFNTLKYVNKLLMGLGNFINHFSHIYTLGRSTAKKTFFFLFYFFFVLDCVRRK